MSVSTARLAANQDSHALVPWRNAPPWERHFGHVSTFATDPLEILALMRSSRGRMQGHLSFQNPLPGSSSHWSQCYCYINPESHSLRYEPDVAGSGFETLLPDLRGLTVQAMIDPSTHTAVLEVYAHSSSDCLMLLPKTRQLFNAWLAALLCWRPVRPGQSIRGPAQPPRPRPQHVPVEPIPASHQQLHEVDLAAVKSEDIDLLHYLPGHPSIHARPSSPPQSQVRCVLRGNGELSLHNLSQSGTTVTVQLSLVLRSAIQRLHRSVFDRDYVIVTTPTRDSASTQTSSQVRPIYLALPSQESFETWFILLRAFAIPELYSPGSLQPGVSIAANKVGEPTGPLRIETSLHVRVNKMRLVEKREGTASNGTPKGQKISAAATESNPAEYFVEILLDEQIKGVTSAKPGAKGDPLWFESLQFGDMSSALSSIGLRVWKRQRQQASARTPLSNALRSEKSTPSKSPVLYDETALCGELTVDAGELETGSEHEQDWPIRDSLGFAVGQVSLKLRQDQEPVLMEEEYDKIHDLVLHFSNNLTLAIYEAVAPRKPVEVVELMLNIFEVSGCAGEWLRYLVGEEIHGRRRQLKKIETNKAMTDEGGAQDDANAATADNDTEESGDRNAEALLLFRGNTLLSRALDSYMKRVGKKYLANTVGSKLQAIMDEDVDCEVDPNRLAKGQDHAANWSRLLRVTEEVWSLISDSAAHCPRELRLVFKHIRECAADRYGDLSRSTGYTSVSSFLFLRFFCAAVLSPQLFGLVRGTPAPRAQRTFMLVAKSLQGLANMTTFGNKEPWMSPMNSFCTAQRAQFETFIDGVCNPRQDKQAGREHRASAQKAVMPIADVYERLPAPAREGFLSLPGLIDPARNLAALANTWLTRASEVDDPTDNRLREMLKGDEDGDLTRFHGLCVQLCEKAGSSLAQVDRSEGTGSSAGGITSPSIARKWDAIAEGMETAPHEYWATAELGQGVERESGGSDDVEAEASTFGIPSILRAEPSPAEAERPRRTLLTKAKRISGDKTGHSGDDTDARSPRSKSVAERQGAASDMGSRKGWALRTGKYQGGSERKGSSSESTTSAESRRKKEKEKEKEQNRKRRSPPRPPQENAMRKLGWM